MSSGIHREPLSTTGATVIGQHRCWLAASMHGNTPSLLPGLGAVYLETEHYETISYP